MGLEDSKISIRAILDIKSILPIEHQWNAIVYKSSNNPFLLSEFAKQFIEHIPKGWTPIILTISIRQSIIGIAPLKTRKNQIGNNVEFLNPSWCSDFIFHEQHRDTCIKYTFDFLFNTLKCNHASFTLRSDSPNLKLLDQQCKLRNIHLKTLPDKGCRIIPIKSAWTEYEASRKRKFRKGLRRAKRNLNKIGAWTVEVIEGNELQEINRKINSVERRSWKEKWRNQRSEKDDWFIVSIIEAAQKLAIIASDFKWGVWFLELEGKTIAYQIVVKYKEVAYLVKTSFDERYMRYYPGIIIQNSVIQQLFNEQQNECINFLSDLPYLQAWTDKVLPRTTFQLTTGAIATIMYSISKNKFATKIISVIFSGQSQT